MVERTPHGKQARLYFIEVEKRWSAASAPKQEHLWLPEEPATEVMDSLRDSISTAFQSYLAE